MPLARIKDRLFYGWVMVAVCFIIGALIFGTRQSFGVFFKSIEGEFYLTRAATSAVFSAYMLLCSAFEILGGWALDRYGPRLVTFLMGWFAGMSLLLTSQVTVAWQLFITYSLLLAAGTGAAYTVMMVTISRWFDKKRGLALGITASGAGFGVLALAPFAAYLISGFGWRWAYIVIGSVTGLVFVSLSRLFKKNPAEIGLLPDGVKRPNSRGPAPPDRGDLAQPGGLSLAQAARTSSFWFLGGVWLLWASCYYLVLTHIVPHATDLGIPAPDAALIIGIIGASSIVGKVAMGWVSDRMGKKPAVVICSLVQASAMVWLISAQDPWMFNLFAAVYGFAHGGIEIPTVALIGDTFGSRSLGVVMGGLHMGWGLGAAIGPAVGGLIFDATHSYNTAFLVGALAMVGTALLVAVTRRETSQTGT